MATIMMILFVLVPIVVIGAIILIIVSATSGKNTDGKAVFNYNDVNPGITRSYFDGSTFGYIGWKILTSLITTLTLGIAYPWAMCMMYRWETKHTVINGRRLKFTGHGGQLFFRYILWSFLTLITFGIYGIWMGLSLEKWKVSHTVYANDYTGVKSRFKGGAGGWFVTHLVSFLIILITFGIGTAWANARIIRWKTRHTYIGGSKLVFTGKGISLFGKYILYGLLTPITLGIFGLFIPVKLLKWEISNKFALYRAAHIRMRSKQHEETAVKDFAKFRIAANDTELTVLKSGINGSETAEQLEEMAESGNPYAKYMVAVNLKSENGAYTDRGKELLKEAAESEYHPALFDYANLYINDNPALYAELLEKSAKNGNSFAVWPLKKYYEKASYDSNGDAVKALYNLRNSAYWFKVAIEQENPEALAEEDSYEKIVDMIAICECHVKSNVFSENMNIAETEERKPASKAQKIVLFSALGVLVVIIAAVVVNLITFLSAIDHPDKSYSNMKLRSVRDENYEYKQVVFMEEKSMSEYKEGDIVIYFASGEYSMYVTKGTITGISENKQGKNVYIIEPSEFSSKSSGIGSLNPLKAVKTVEKVASAEGNETESENETGKAVVENLVLGVYVKDTGFIKNWLATKVFSKSYDDLHEAYQSWTDYGNVNCIYGNASYSLSYWDLCNIEDEENCVAYNDLENGLEVDYEYENIRIDSEFSQYSNYNGDFNVVHPESIKISFSLSADSTDSVFLACDDFGYYNEITGRSDLKILTGEIKPGSTINEINLDKAISERISARHSKNMSKTVEYNFYVIVAKECDGGFEYYVAGEEELKIRIFEVTDTERLSNCWFRFYREGNRVFCEQYAIQEDNSFYYEIFEYAHPKVTGDYDFGDSWYFYNRTEISKGSCFTDDEYVISKLEMEYRLYGDESGTLHRDKYDVVMIDGDHMILKDESGNQKKYSTYWDYDVVDDAESILKMEGIDATVSG